MTYSIAKQLEQTRLSGEHIPNLMEPMFFFQLREQTRLSSRTMFPSKKYRDDPVRFFREVIGVEPWSKQVEIINAIRDHSRVAIKSGHKISKSHTAAGCAFWYYCSFDDARVIMTSTTSRQVDDILWREARMMRARSGLCVACKIENESRELRHKIQVPCPHSAIIDGEMGAMARTGIKSEDFREIKGFTASEAEGVAGISGKNLLYIVDEASGVKDEIFEAIEGNRMGGAREVYFSNPTRTSGKFYMAFTKDAEFYHCMTVASTDTPNCVYGDDDPRAVPGLATRKETGEVKRKYGEDSAFYKVRVLGEFVESEEGKIFSVHLIGEAEERWAYASIEGRLIIGLDPAGPGSKGDETVWAPRRDKKILELEAKRGISEASIIANTLGLVKKHRREREVPAIVLDREGKLGSEIYGAMVAYLTDEKAKRRQPSFELVVVRASDRAHKSPLVYDRMRDELAANFYDWVVDGGAIPEDSMLSTEMHAFEWLEPEKNGRVKVTSKKELRKTLGRSPDRFDACALACWETMRVKDNKPERPRSESFEDAGRPVMDPYGGM